MSLVEILRSSTIPLRKKIFEYGRLTYLMSSEAFYAEQDAHGIEAAFRDVIAAGLKAEYLLLESHANILAHEVQDALGDIANHVRRTSAETISTEHADAYAWNAFVTDFHAEIASMNMSIYEEEEAIAFCSAYARRVADKEEAIADLGLESPGGVAVQTFVRTMDAVMSGSQGNLLKVDAALDSFKQLVHDQDYVLSWGDFTSFRDSLLEASHEFGTTLFDGMKRIVTSYVEDTYPAQLEQFNVYRQKVRSAAEENKIRAFTLMSPYIEHSLQDQPGEAFFYDGMRSHSSNLIEFVTMTPEDTLDPAIQDGQYTDMLCAKHRCSDEDVDAQVKEFAQYILNKAQEEETVNISSIFPEYVGVRYAGPDKLAIPEIAFCNMVLYSMVQHGYVQVAPEFGGTLRGFNEHVVLDPFIPFVLSLGENKLV